MGGDTRISNLPLNPNALTGTEYVPIVQNGQSYKTFLSQLIGLAFTVGTYLPLIGGLMTGVARAWYSSTAVSTTSTFTFNPFTQGQVAKITLTGAITVTFGAPTNIIEGAMYKFLLTAGDSAGRTFAWNTAYKFPAATAPVTSGSTTTGAIDIITFIGGASNTLIYDGSVTNVR
jgi:hypothetical protein